MRAPKVRDAALPTPIGQGLSLSDGLREIQPVEALKGDDKEPDKPVVHPPAVPSGRGVRLSPVSTIPPSTTYSGSTGQMILDGTARQFGSSPVKQQE